MALVIKDLSANAEDVRGVDKAKNTCRYYGSRKVQGDKSKTKSSKESIVIKNQSH